MPDPTSLDRLHQLASRCVATVTAIWQRASYPSGMARTLGLASRVLSDSAFTAPGIAVVRDAVDELVAAEEEARAILPSARPCVIQGRGRTRLEPFFRGCGLQTTSAHEAAFQLANDVLVSVYIGLGEHRQPVSKAITQGTIRKVYNTLYEDHAEQFSEEDLNCLQQEMDVEYAAATDLLIQHCPGDGTVDPKHGKKSQPKRSTEKGEARRKIIAALTAHHRYQDDSCLNQEPIGGNELAKKADVTKGSVSRFFKKEFGDHGTYRSKCQDIDVLIASLKLLNQEFSARDLYGRNPPGESSGDDED